MILGGFALLVLIATPVNAWYSSYWNYAMNFTDSRGYIYNNRTANLTFDSYTLQQQGKLTENCSDIRIVNDMNISLDYKIYGCGQRNATLWFNYTNDTTTGDYQLYYGYNFSDIQPIYNFTHFTYGEDFDNFTSGSDIPTQKTEWTVHAGLDNKEATNAKAYSGYLYNHSGIFADTDNGAGWFAYNWSYHLYAGKFKVRFLTTAGNLDPNPFMIRDDVGNDVMISVIDYGNANKLAYYYAGSGATTLAYLTLNTWYQLELEWNTTGFNITLRNDTFLKVDTGRAHRDGANIGVNRWLWDSGANSQFTVYIDELMVWNATGQAYFDPAFVLGAEWNATSPAVPPAPIPTIEDFDYCRLLWAEQHAGVLSNHNWCIDNQTIARNVSFQITVDGNVSTIVSYSTEICRWGCDNRTNSCNPSPIGQYGIWAGWGSLIFIALGVLIWLWRRI